MNELRSVYRGKFLEFFVRGKWEFVQRVGAPACVGIVALTSDRRIILIKQFRIPVGKVCVEIPAGIIGDHGDEDWKAGAVRELREETGYTATDMVYLTEGPSSAGLTTECIMLARAVGVSKAGEPEPDADEHIQVHEVPLDAVDGFLRACEGRGELVDPKVFAALYFLRNA